MGKSTKVEAPEADPRIGEAALKQAQLGEDWLTLAREQYGVANTRQADLDRISKEVAGQQLQASKQAQQWAGEDRARYTGTFVPLQNEFIDTAKTWDSAARQQTVAAEAKADVLNSAAEQNAARERRMAAMGVDPTSGRYAGVERAADTETALAAAGAQNKARNDVRKQGLALRADAVNMGNGLAVNPAASLGLGVQAGGAAVGTTASTNQAANANTGILQAGYNTAMQGYTNQANTLQNQYNSQLNAWSAQQQASAQSTAGLFGGIGSLMGGALGFFSSKRLKTDKRPARGALDQVMRMPVEEWRYKPGVADGAEHIGPYAEDFQAATGKGDGKTIPVVDAIGVTMGAVRELAEEVRAIERGIVAARGDNERTTARKGRGVMEAGR